MGSRVVEPGWKARAAIVGARLECEESEKEE